MDAPALADDVHSLALPETVAGAVTALDFASMATLLLRAADARTLVRHVRSRLLAAMQAAGFEGAESQALSRKSPDQDATLAVLSTTLHVWDPLHLSGGADSLAPVFGFDVLLRLCLKQAKNGCMLTMSTEVRRDPADVVIVKRETLLFLSWDICDLAGMYDVFRKALAALAVRPETVFADTDFDILPRNLTLALAP